MSKGTIYKILLLRLPNYYLYIANEIALNKVEDRVGGSRRRGNSIKIVVRSNIMLRDTLQSFIC